MIPFSPPKIFPETIEEIEKVLKSGWITTGPRTKAFEKELTDYCGSKATLCQSSATAGMELMLRWFGIGEGDEVILPTYTYCATANVVVHCGATPVLVDVRKDDFNIDVNRIAAAITSKTKVIMPVDFAGMPCDYDALMKLAVESKARFSPQNDVQRQLGRILILADAAHSFGAEYEGKKSGALADASVFSFHAVKNLTTGEGGAIALNLPKPFDNEAIYKELCIYSLHGQSKDALAKTQKGGWQYDVAKPGFKSNMTDIMAAIGQVGLKHYGEILEKRKTIFDAYDAAFQKYEWAERPLYEDEKRKTSYHVYALRVKNVSEVQRNTIIQKITQKEVSVNVHFQPLPILSFYKNLGYKMDDYPVAKDNFSREITLPVFYDLSKSDVETIIDAVVKSVEEIINN